MAVEVPLPAAVSGVAPHPFNVPSEDENAIVPDGATEPVEAGVTVAVKVTDSVAALAAPVEEVTLSVVPAFWTTSCTVPGDPAE